MPKPEKSGVSLKTIRSNESIISAKAERELIHYLRPCLGERRVTATRVSRGTLNDLWVNHLKAMHHPDKVILAVTLTALKLKQ